MNEEVWAGVVAFLGALGLMLKFWKSGKGHEEKEKHVPSDQSNRLSVVETKTAGLEEAVDRIELKQETMRVEQREDIQGVHSKLDGITQILIEVKNNGRGRR